MNIIGLDAAVQDKNVGCVLGEYSNGILKIKAKWSRKEPLTDVLAGWVQSSAPTIIAIDAPLGWPVSFRKILANHWAGRPLDLDPEIFFKRRTDLDIKKRFKKTTLEISADRIARTAFFTLKRMGSVEKKLNSEIPLLWSMHELDNYGLLEVYPAATLLSNGLNIKGYKKDNLTARRNLLEQLRSNYTFSNPEAIDLTTVEHDFDAFVCCLACLDFIEGKSLPPDEIDEYIKEEGWIWVKK